MSMDDCQSPMHKKHAMSASGHAFETQHCSISFECERRRVGRSSSYDRSSAAQLRCNTATQLMPLNFTQCLVAATVPRSKKSQLAQLQWITLLRQLGSCRQTQKLDQHSRPS